MNFQQKLFETGARLRARAFQLVDAVQLRQPATVIGEAGRELGKVARRHAARFVKQNAALATIVREDMGEIARNTLNSLQTGARPRKPAARKRKAKARARAKAA